jgi:hypothetical protein
MTPFQPQDSKRETARNAKADLDVEKVVPAALWGLAVMTGLGTIAAVAPHILSGGSAIGASLVSGLMLFGAAGATWHLLKSGRTANAQEILLREAFHGVLTPQLVTDQDGNAALANRAFRGWIDLAGQNAESALTARFSATTAVSAEFSQLKAALDRKSVV